MLWYLETPSSSVPRGMIMPTGSHANIIIRAPSLDLKHDQAHNAETEQAHHGLLHLLRESSASRLGWPGRRGVGGSRWHRCACQNGWTR